MIGVGAMLHDMGGGSKHSSAEYIGRIIKSAAIVDDMFRIEFTDGTKIQIWDDGQSCCESRYITCDDKPEDLIGGKWVEAGVKKFTGIRGDDEHIDDGDHEIAFVVIQTDKTAVTFCTHNEHNGYYGGFGLTITEDE